MNTRKKLVAVAAMAMAAFTGGAQVSQSLEAPTQQTQNQREIKGRAVTREAYNRRIAIASGGLDLVHENYDRYGMSPKEYGIRYGHGNKSQRSNRLRMSHNAKLKRRLS